MEPPTFFQTQLPGARGSLLLTCHFMLPLTPPWNEAELNVNKGDMQCPGRTNMDQHGPVYGDIMGIQVRISWNAHIALYNDNNTITIICIFILIYVLLQATNINQLYCWVGLKWGMGPSKEMFMRI